MQSWAEITIDRLKIMDALPPGAFFRFAHHGGEMYGPEKVHVAADLVKEIEAHGAAGVRALLVTIRNCEGGSITAAERLYAALRAFSDRGGRVVVYVEGMAASSAAHLALAGDYVLVNPAATFVLHSAVVGGPLPAEERERIRLAQHEASKAVALERTITPPAAMDDALACEYDPGRDLWTVKVIGPEVALEWRWADAITDLEGARAFTRMVAACPFETPRAAVLTKRAQARAAVIAAARPAVDATCTISANKFTGDALQTANYAQDASGNPTAGAKLDTYGTAVKVAPANLQIGKTLIRDTWFANQRQIAGRRLTYTGGAWTLASTDGGLSIGGWNATTKQLRIVAPGAGASGFGDAVVQASRIDAVNAGPYELRVPHLNRGSNATDLWFDLELWQFRVWWDEVLWVQSANELVDWTSLGANSPAFDLKVTSTVRSHAWPTKLEV